MAQRAAHLQLIFWPKSGARFPTRFRRLPPKAKPRRERGRLAKDPQRVETGRGAVAGRRQSLPKATLFARTSTPESAIRPRAFMSTHVHFARGPRGAGTLKAPNRLQKRRAPTQARELTQFLPHGEVTGEEALADGSANLRGLRRGEPLLLLDETP